MIERLPRDSRQKRGGGLKLPLPPSPPLLGQGRGEVASQLPPLPPPGTQGGGWGTGLTSYPPLPALLCGSAAGGRGA